jgi:hypothetical protein
MRFTGLFLLLSFALPANLLLGDSLYSLSGVSQTFTYNPLTLGFAFTANSDFMVTSLGWFDATGTGFQSPHTVGIFDSQGNLLTSTTLASGAGDLLPGFFRYEATAPTTLIAGNTYTLAGTTGGAADSWTVNNYVSGFNVNPEFTIGADAALFSYGSGLVEPTSHFSDYRVYAGPNLSGTSVNTTTPEPGTLALVGLAMTMLLVAAARRASSRRTESPMMVG